MSWLAFETNILSRIDFDSIAIPFSRDPELGVALKRRGKRVSTNDILQSAWTSNLAGIQNNSERLSEKDIETILQDAYVPRYKPRNDSLRNWFNETDAWWFDNVRRNLDRIESPYLFAVGASLAMQVVDYAASFNEETREFRRPLSDVFRELWSLRSAPVNNSQNNSCQNKNGDDFLGESFVHCMFLRLPSLEGEMTASERRREEWLRGSDGFWPAIDSEQEGRLGSRTRSKSQYLLMLEKTLGVAANINHWAIAHVENGFLTTQELVEIVAKKRRVEAVYTKDFSELIGSKAVIITA